MASLKLATLAIRTIAKPISNRLKQEAREYPFFRRICVQLAQSMYSAEMRLGTFVLGQPPKAVKPLSEAKAIESGATFIAEAFLFAVAASLIVAESWRSSSKESRRRETIAEGIEDLKKGLEGLSTRVGQVERILVGVSISDGDTGGGGGYVEAGGVKRGDEGEDEGEGTGLALGGGEMGLGQRVRDVEEKSEQLTRVLERLVNVGINNGSGWLTDVNLGSTSLRPLDGKGRSRSDSSSNSTSRSSS